MRRGFHKKPRLFFFLPEMIGRYAQLLKSLEGEKVVRRIHAIGEMNEIQSKQGFGALTMETRPETVRPFVERLIAGRQTHVNLMERFRM